MTTYQITFQLTIAVELLIIWLITRREDWPGQQRAYLAVGLFLNLFTHPIASLAVQEFDQPWLLVEFAVLVVETLGYRLLTDADLRRSIVLALATNGVTAALSFLF